MDAIPPSEAADSQVGGGDHVDELEAEDFHPNPNLQPNQLVAGSLPVIGNVMLTPAGIRSILGRKLRQKPLLRLVCKGCGMTTHDKDPLVPGDFVEWLGSACELVSCSFDF